MPDRLRLLVEEQQQRLPPRAGAEGGVEGGDGPPAQPPLPALRVWTTMLCVCALRRLDESVLLKTSERDGFEETIVDRAMEWLLAMARAPLMPLGAPAFTCSPRLQRAPPLRA